MINAAALNVIPLPTPMAVVEQFLSKAKSMEGRRAILHMENPNSPFNNLYTGELAVEGKELILKLDEDQKFNWEESITLVSPEFNNLHRHGMVSLSLQ